MNKFVFTALATTMVGATGLATDSEWPELDRELAALNNAPLIQDDSGPNLSGWLIAAISSDDTPADSANDVLGTGVAAARVNISGSVGGDYEYKLGFDFTDTQELWRDGAGDGTNVASSGTAGLTDAYVRFGIGETMGVVIGAFTPDFLRSSGLQRNQTLFITRSYLGGMYAGRDAGFALDGNFSRVNWQIAFMNGHSGTGDDFAFVGHVDIDLLGTASASEGAQGAAEGTNLNVGISFRDDGADAHANTGGTSTPGDSREDSQLAFDVTLTSGAFAVWGEMVDQDTDSVAFQGPGGQGASPYSVGASFAFGEVYELAVRWDDYDDSDNQTRVNIGVNRYISGHDVKWQLNLSSGDSDDPNDENDVIALGLAVGF